MSSESRYLYLVYPVREGIYIVYTQCEQIFIFCLSSESRYLLILTENYAALGILQQQLLDHDKTTVIFGSSFPKDQEYTQVS